MTTWIAIKNQTPALGQPVLLYDANRAKNEDVREFAKYLASELTDQNGQLEWSMAFGEAQNFHNYTHWMPLPEPPIPEDEQTEAIRMVADSVLSHHIPHDARLQEFAFNIIVEGIAYEVSYLKDTEGYWTFNSYQFLR
jgi:hypothetical protein